ncbi:MAG: OmpW/AlkL family protein [Parahaliea sp.]
MNKLTSIAMVAALAAAGSTGAAAYEQGDLILRLGAITVAPDEDSDDINLPTAPAVTSLPGISIDNDTQLGIAGTWMFRDQWGLEVLAATPFEHDFKVNGLNIDGGSVSHLPPTVSVQWYPRGGSAGWQPYLGVGVNYTYIYDEEVSGTLKGALGAVLGASSAKLDLDNSIGPAVQAGLDIPLGENIALNIGVWYIDIGTEATIKTDVGKVKFDVDIDPWVYNVGIAWRF